MFIFLLWSIMDMTIVYKILCPPRQISFRWCILEIKLPKWRAILYKMLMQIDTGMKIFANYCHALINCIFESICCLQESKSFLRTSLPPFVQSCKMCTCDWANSQEKWSSVSWLFFKLKKGIWDSLAQVFISSYCVFFLGQFDP